MPPLRGQTDEGASGRRAKVTSVDYLLVADGQFDVVVSEDDGEAILAAAERILAAWVEEEGVAQGDLAVFLAPDTHWIAEPNCRHRLSGEGARDLADEIAALHCEHKLGVGARVLILREAPEVELA